MLDKDIEEKSNTKEKSDIEKRSNTQEKSDNEEKSNTKEKSEEEPDYFSEHYDIDEEIFEEFKSKHDVKLHYNIYKEKVEIYNKKENRNFDREATFKILEKNPEKGGYNGWVKVTTTRRKIGAVLPEAETVTANAAVTK
jgi:hypothetical protein